MRKLSTEARFLERVSSENLKELFYESISENNALGKDGISYSKFSENIDAEIDVIVRKVRSGTYKFTVYKEKLISKGFGKEPRQLSIPTIRDRLLLKLMSNFLAEVYSDTKTPVPQAIVKSVKKLAENAATGTFFLRMDVKSFYPNIDHNILLKTIRRRIRSDIVLGLVEGAISTSTGQSRKFSPKGVPQGLSISNILAHIYLRDLDSYFKKRFQYFRYVDDIIVLAPYCQAIDAEKAIRKLFLSKRRLECHPMDDSSKSSLLPVVDGVEYLGYRFVVGKVSVRRSSYDRMFANIMKIITNVKHHRSSASGLFKLNLRITGCRFNGEKVGWLNYFSQINDLHQLKKLDQFVQSNVQEVFSGSEKSEVKSFIKAYHEIAFNFRKTTYIPNFDHSDLEEKKDKIALLDASIPFEKIDNYSEAEVIALFDRLLKREVRDIEKDVLSVLS
ncbi:reverse transcriptase domain-containing protein [Thalassospira lucentensis]|uniref:reverse transcriptase domain-containing protein n=1 Tax=Thalassospira lucentensis TaxID=168935 RepID=UPI003D2E021B